MCMVSTMSPVSMRPIQARVVAPGVEIGLPPDLLALRRFARFMDEAVPIPGTTRRVGLDPLLGLIPGIGDTLGAVCSLWIVYGALRHRVPARHVVRMVWNILVDALVGSIPVLGDLFDVFWETNIWNVELVVRHRDPTRVPRKPQEVGLVLGLVVAGVLGILLLVLFGMVAAIVSLVGHAF